MCRGCKNFPQNNNISTIEGAEVALSQARDEATAKRKQEEQLLAANPPKRPRRHQEEIVIERQLDMKAKISPYRSTYLFRTVEGILKIPKFI